MFARSTGTAPALMAFTILYTYFLAVLKSTMISSFLIQLNERVPQCVGFEFGIDIKIDHTIQCLDQWS
jgi:hypothetical protein